MSKIALVDDDRNILTSVSMTLEAEGFEVETYNDGQTAADVTSEPLSARFVVGLPI
jgi:two-component system response regulator ChvI